MNSYDLARQELREVLLKHPRRFGYEWTPGAASDLLRRLFSILCARDDPTYVSLLFPDQNHLSDRPLKLKEAQGAKAGKEYTEAARGKRCGHIFGDGEATYSCRTCTADVTCVLCTRCFHASVHEGHQVSVSLSGGTGGCCDCGDPEAWKREVICAIHSPNDPTSRHEASSTQNDTAAVSEDFRPWIEGTISAAMDFVIDVFSCSSDSMKVPQGIDAEARVLADYEQSGLGQWYGDATLDEKTSDYVLVLWNDEKHTVDEVTEQVARATRRPRSYGLARARAIDAVGRTIISRSDSISHLLQQAKILSQIKLTVTLRSARDTFREEMCATVIDWLNDIAGCSVGEDHHLLMETVCRQLLRPWTIGSSAFNLGIARGGHRDEQASDDRLRRQKQALRDSMIRERMRAWQQEARQERRGLQATAAGAADATGATAATGAQNDEPLDLDVHGAEAQDEDELEEEEEMTDLNGEGEGADDLMELDATDDVVLTIGNNNAEVAIVAIEGLMDHSQEAQGGHEDLDQQEAESEEDEAPIERQRDANALFDQIPRPRGKPAPARRPPPPKYWTNGTTSPSRSTPSSVEEDMSQRVRVDHLVFYDMRMWKNLRQSLRHLYISTLVTVPKFKRILSLRFAALYTHLSQLYLLADREADHSIIFMSLQMLTTPSIAEEIVTKGNFYTRLLAILYTFLTARQVGEPQDVDLAASISLESGTIGNRRFYHVFHDMNYLLEVPAVKDFIRVRPECSSQFLDFAKLFQGICPSTRAVGEHVEYESDTWLMASYLTRDVSRLSKQFSDCFRWQRMDDPSNICRAIRQAAKAAIQSSPNMQSTRPEEAQAVSYKDFRMLSTFVIDCEVEKTPQSLWHPLHYILSWLIDAGKSMSSQQLSGLLTFTKQQLSTPEPAPGFVADIPELEPGKYLLALLDTPVRIVAFLAQVRAGMWIRNGMALKQQVDYYRSVHQRDMSHQRDLFLVQTGFVVCDPDHFLANVIDRFSLTEWLHNRYSIKDGFDEGQWIDVVEEFLHLLVIVLSDRTLLVAPEEEPNVRLIVAQRDIVHALCFKPLTHSELTARLPEKVMDLDEFEAILEDVAIYKGPEGLSDAGTHRLKEEHITRVDPYYAYYNKSQREEAENIARMCYAKRMSKHVDEVFLEPQLRPLRTGVFSGLARFSQGRLFAATIQSILHYIINHSAITPSVQATRTEALLQVLLHLVLIAIAESTGSKIVSSERSFLQRACTPDMPSDGQSQTTIFQQLFYLGFLERYRSSHARIKHVLLCMRTTDSVAFDEGCRLDDSGFVRPDILQEQQAEPATDSSSAKKREALARQAKVLASFKQQQSDFMENQTFDWGDDVMSDSDDDFTLASEAPSKTWEVPGGTCILCQEETGERRLHGTLAFFCESKIFRQTDLSDRQHIRDIRSLPDRLDQDLDTIRSRTRSGSDASAIKTPSGFVRTALPSNVAGQTRSNTHMRSGSVFSGCGHVMHWACFNNYWAATTRRHNSQFARNHPEQINLKEFLCPLCKAVGNAFVPVSWKPKPAIDYVTSVPLDMLRWANESYRAEILVALSGEPFYQSLTSPEASETLKPELLSRHRDDFSAMTGRASVPLQELYSANSRLVQTIKANGLLARDPQQGPLSDDVEGVRALESLIESLAWTVSATEIAHRGHQSSGIWIDNVSPHTLTQLRTMYDMVAIYGTVSASTEGQKQEPIVASSIRLSAQNHLAAMYDEGSVGRLFVPLLGQDIFTYLVQSSFYIGPIGVESFLQHMRIALLAEVVKLVVAAVRSPTAIEQSLAEEAALPQVPSTPKQTEGFSILVQHVINNHRVLQDASEVGASMGGTAAPSGVYDLEVTDDPTRRVSFDTTLRSMAFRYALAFARKCLLLLHVRFGIDYSSVRTSIERPELDVLSELLHLPQLDELVRLPYDQQPGSVQLRALIDTWVNSWLWVSSIGRQDVEEYDKARLAIQARSACRMPHPTAYELASLPRVHDTLNAIVLDRKCPSTGGPLQDPCVCLFCGSIFCGQANCCRNSKGHGGCTQHQEVCGRNVGIFLDIRRCTVLMMYHKSGSFFTAPYLDKHGEADTGLRRHGQLFLSQKRYDRLFRDFWLGFNGGIPSAVARKLDNELNTGGWETL